MQVAVKSSSQDYSKTNSTVISYSYSKIVIKDTTVHMGITTTEAWGIMEARIEVAFRTYCHQGAMAYMDWIKGSSYMVASTKEITRPLKAYMESTVMWGVTKEAGSRFTNLSIEWH